MTLNLIIFFLQFDKYGVQTTPESLNLKTSACKFDVKILTKAFIKWYTVILVTQGEEQNIY